MKLRFIYIVAFLLVSTSNLWSQQKVVAINYPSNDRMTVKFTTFPINYKTELSDDKRRVVVRLKSAQAVDSVRNIRPFGAFSEVYFESKKNDLNIYVSSTNPTGYTASALPFTKTLVIDLFKWETLSSANDYYRTGLLAFEDNIYSSAKTDLTSAVREGNTEASLFLAIVLMQEGKINSAIKNLEYAENKQVPFADVYAALAQCYKAKGDLDKSRVYEDKFFQSTGLRYYQPIAIKEIIETDSLLTEPVAHLVLTTPQDTSKVAPDTATTNKFSMLFKDSTSKEEEVAIPSVYSELLTIVGAIAGGIALLVLFFYFRWRSKQMALRQATIDGLKATKASKTTKQKTTSKPEAKHDDKQNIEAKRLLAEKLYGNKSKATGTVKSDEAKPKKDDSKYAPKISKQEEIKQQNIDNILETIRAVSEEKSALENAQDVEPDYIEPPKKPISAKLEMAMNLAEEQRKIKEKNIASIDEQVIKGANRLSDVAKSLGIERGGLETKKAIQDIEKDSDYLENLRKKFE